LLFYLDNWMSADPNGPHPGTGLGGRARGDLPPPGRGARGRFGVIMPPRPRPSPQGKNASKGLNENYGRELMELHTLSVDGGYTQKDVTEVARAFTGWTIRRPQGEAEFYFEPRIHDAGEKTVLGQRIPAGGGMDDGLPVVDLLAH